MTEEEADAVLSQFGFETPVPTEEPIIEETPIPTEEPIIEETPIPTEEPIIEETPIPTEEPIIEETPIPTEEPIIEETPIPTENLRQSRRLSFRSMRRSTSRKRCFSLARTNGMPRAR